MQMPRRGNPNRAPHEYPASPDHRALNANIRVHVAKDTAPYRCRPFAMRVYRQKSMHSHQSHQRKRVLKRPSDQPAAHLSDRIVLRYALGTQS